MKTARFFFLFAVVALADKIACFAERQLDHDFPDVCMCLMVVAIFTAGENIARELKRIADKIDP